MALLSTLYLEVFVLIASFGLWRKNLYGTAVDHMSAHTPIYKVMYITSVTVSPRAFYIAHHLTIRSLKASFTMDSYGTVFVNSVVDHSLVSFQGLVFHTTRNEENDGDLSRDWFRFHSRLVDLVLFRCFSMVSLSRIQLNFLSELY